MPEDKKEEERDDAAAGTLLKTAIDRMDALHKRLDSMEEERKADRARKDSEEEERKDAARKDSEREEREDAMRADKSRKDSKEEERDDKARKDSKEEEKEERDDSTVFYRGNKAPKTKSDSEEEREDSRHRKDSEEREDSEHRKDAKHREDKARKDSEEEAMADSFSKVAERIARVERMLPAQLTDEDRAKFSEVQARADSVFHAFGSVAPAPLQGETLLAYRQRLTNSLKSNSKTFKDVNVYAIGDAVAFGAIEDVVYNDAMSVAMSPATAQPGTLRAISKKSGGHEFITYVGDPAAWMNDFAGPVRQYATAINTPNMGQR